MKTYRMEINALHIIDVDATSAKEALNKSKEVGLNATTTNSIAYNNGCKATYHYEDFDFNEATIRKFC